MEQIGLTAIGQPDAMREVIRSGQFATIQVPFNILNRSAGETVDENFGEADYGNVIHDAAQQNMGVLVIRVFASGTQTGQAPSQHTFKTKFFPLDLYRRDQWRCEQLKQILPPDIGFKDAALQFVLSHPHVTAAIIGFGQPEHVNDATAALRAGSLSEDLVQKLRT